MSRVRDLTELSELEPRDERRDWSRLMRELSRDGEIASWRARIEWLQSARVRLSDLLEEYERVRFIRARVVPPSPAERAPSAPVGSFERVDRSRAGERRAFQAAARSTHPYGRGAGGRAARPATGAESELKDPAPTAPAPKAGLQAAAVTAPVAVIVEPATALMPGALQLARRAAWRSPQTPARSMRAPHTNGTPTTSKLRRRRRATWLCCRRARGRAPPRAAFSADAATARRAASGAPRAQLPARAPRSARRYVRARRR